MAKRPANMPSAAGKVTPSSSIGVTPSPHNGLHVSRIIWQQGKTIHRVHLDRYPGDAFNPGVAGNARFSPIQTSAGVAIPTLYGGTSFDCAAMETIFHDVPFMAGFKSYDKRKLIEQRHSVLVPDKDLALADLSQVALRKMGIRRAELIDTEKDRYPDTRQWAVAIYTQCPKIQGLRWISRQDDRAEAIVLFGDRIDTGTLVQTGAPRDILADANAYGDVLLLATAIGVHLVDGA